ncbi:MAG: hypothetical protein A2096_14690 [Spirochaetes bacterium GWF1_41_5]|nr:MAG: hypothetical protein A2096_14690 [Spirochaetes bacterium GWF1_41_5]
MKKYIFLLILIPVFAAATMFFWNEKNNPRKLRDNPADRKATNYQGYDTKTKEQNIHILNAADLSNGITRTAIVSNSGWKPEQYMISIKNDFSDFPVWSNMPADRRWTKIELADRTGWQAIYTKFKFIDGSELSYSNAVYYTAPGVTGITISYSQQGLSPKIRINWTANSIYSAYSVYASTNADTGYTLKGTTLNTWLDTISFVTGGTKYFKVAGISGTTEGALSAAVSAVYCNVYYSDFSDGGTTGWTALGGSSMSAASGALVGSSPAIAGAIIQLSVDTISSGVINIEYKCKYLSPANYMMDVGLYDGTFIGGIKTQYAMEAGPVYVNKHFWGAAGASTTIAKTSTSKWHETDHIVKLTYTLGATTCLFYIDNTLCGTFNIYGTGIADSAMSSFKYLKFTLNNATLTDTVTIDNLKIWSE